MFLKIKRHKKLPVVSFMTLFKVLHGNYGSCSIHLTLIEPVKSGNMKKRQKDKQDERSEHIKRGGADQGGSPSFKEALGFYYCTSAPACYHYCRSLSKTHDKDRLKLQRSVMRRHGTYS